MFEREWLTLQLLINKNDLLNAEDFVKQMHRCYQQQSLNHARIHFVWSRIARLRKAYIVSLGQWLIAVVF